MSEIVDDHKYIFIFMYDDSQLRAFQRKFQRQAETSGRAVETLICPVSHSEIVYHNRSHIYLTHTYAALRCGRVRNRSN